MFRRYWKINQIPRLEDLAFEASFKDIMDHLTVCNDHHQMDTFTGEVFNKKLNLASSSSILETNSVLTSQKVVQFVKNHLNQYLAVTMSEKLRRKYVEKFFKCINEDDDLIPEIWVFLECVLDDSFQELKTHIALQSSGPNQMLVSTIAKQCTQLKKLELDFDLAFDPSIDTDMVDRLIPVVQSLSTLPNLTSLSLNKLHKLHRPLLKFLGKSVPSISHLCLNGFNIKKRDVLALITGELVDDLFPNAEKETGWSHDAAVELVQLPPEFLTPLCFSLHHLETVYCLEHESMKEWAFTSSTAAFCLRHLPALRSINGCEGTGMGAKMIYEDRPEANGVEVQSRFENVCRKVQANRSTTFPMITFPGDSGRPLSLTSIKGVTVLDEQMIRIVGSMCPSLKNVDFNECTYRNDFKLHLEYSEVYGKMTPKKLELLLTAWPKLETITVSEVSSKFVKPLLNVFGPKLKDLTFESGREVNMMDLVPCIELETLRIEAYSLNKGALKVAGLSLKSDIFLPRLKSIKSELCLGPLSRLIENKPTMAHLDLNCYHMGTKGNPDLDWCQIHNAWPQLEYLRVQRHSGSLTFSTITSSMQRFSYLKEVHLPSKILKNGECQLVSYSMDDFSYQWPEKVKVIFFELRYPDNCTFISSKAKK